MVKNLSANAEDAGDTIPTWVGKIPWSRKWHSPQSLPRKFHGGGAWQATGHGVAELGMIEQKGLQFSAFKYTFPTA